MDEAAVDVAGWECRMVQGGVEISGLAAARIFTPDGRMVRQIVPGGDTTTVELPAGLYIVTAAGRSIKVAVR